MEDFGNLLVTPEKLGQTAERMSGLLQKAEELLQQLEEAAENTRNCFWGKTAEQFKRSIQEASKAEGEQLKRMADFPVKLTAVADAYTQAEKENKNVFVRN